MLFGDYQLVGDIACGGMAEVYYAIPWTEVPDRVLAIKCIRPTLAQEQRFVDMFVREGRLAMLLRHPNIVGTEGVGDVDGRSYIVMEYIGGKDLNALLRRCQETSRRIPIPHALHIATGICRALHYAHELKNDQGRPLDIVNRDVSPSNVRITYDGSVRILDFGIAQAVMQVKSEIGILKGKFAYMSPEQVRGLPLDRRTDIFSTGIVLHELLTTERLFREESEFVLMEKVRQTNIKPPSAYNKRVPPEVDALVMRALERDPARRYQTAEAFAAAIAPLLERYQFDPAELGELNRSLYPADARKEQELLNQLLQANQTAEEGPQKRPRSKTQPRPRRSRPASAPDGPKKAKVHWAVWLSAAALLLAASVLMIIALR